MTKFESFLLSYLVNAAWQVPLLFAVGWAATRAVRTMGPRVEHRIWVAALLLQSVIPAGSSFPRDSLRWLALWARAPVPDPESHVAIIMGPSTAWSGLFLPAWMLAAVAIAYAAVTAYFAARFAWRLLKIRALRRNATEVPLAGDAAQCWAQCAEIFKIGNASIASSSQVFGPVTIGIAHKLVLLPAGMAATLPETEMRAAIAHEFAHMQRNDFLKNLVYELLTLPVSFHPFLWLTRERVMESREMVCDRMAAESGEHNQYLRSLLRLASLLVEGMSTRTPHAIGIFDATTFERRVMRLTENQNVVSAARRWVVGAGCALLGVGICASTLMLSVHVDAMAAGDEKATSTNGPVNVSSDKMAAQLLSKTNPVYPPEAKKAGIQGTVKLEAVISKTGEVDQLKVTSGAAELQQSALDAVRKWTYKPFLVNGDPVEVKTTINITYSLKK
jgi:TonB family protein